MADCCEDKSCVIDALRSRQSRTLKIVLAINAIMFLVEFIASLRELNGSAVRFSRQPG